MNNGKNELINKDFALSEEFKAIFKKEFGDDFSAILTFVVSQGGIRALTLEYKIQ